jgi:oligoendopeptidase F
VPENIRVIRELIHTLVLVLLVVLCLSVTLNGLAFGQEKFAAIPSAEVELYHINFARNFFPSPQAEKADRVNLYSTLRDLESLKGKLGDSAGNLLRALQIHDRVQVQLHRHYSYLYLRNAVNTTDESSLAEASALDAEVNTRTRFLQEEVMHIDDQKLAEFIVRNSELAVYRAAIERMRRNRSHTLSTSEEEVLSATAPNNDWYSELYDRLRSAPQSSSARDLFAFTLTRLASSRTRLARLHHFPDAASEVYFNSYWTRAEVDDLLRQIAEHAEMYKRYQRLRAEHAKNVSDAKETGQPPRYTIDQAGETIRSALKPLGPEYGRELAALLDPANGRMDIVPGEHRKRGGFSQGFIGTDSVFYSVGFSGSYNDLRILMHESTHAVHRQLMNASRVLPDYAEGPHYLFEAFAIFNELLLPDYLYQHESDPARKQFYLEQFLQGKGTIIFVVAPEVELEHAVYDGVTQGTLKGADDLDALSERIFSRYFVQPSNELRIRWTTISLMYEDPFYDINYIYGALLALNFYQLYLHDPQWFVPHYIALLKNGFNASPEMLLLRFLDIDIHDPRVVSQAISLMEERIDLLEKSYREKG